MAELTLIGGKAYLQDPATGSTHAVDEAEIPAMLEAGFVPTTTAETAKERVKERYGGTGYAALSALAGAGRGATLGLSDVLLTKGGLVAPETLAMLKQANPAASAVGDIAGSVGSMLIPGSPLARIAQAGRAAGGRVASVTARGLETSAGSALPRLAGTLASEGITGAAVGLGGGISDVTLSPEMEPAEATARILSSMARGGAIGAGVGSMGWLAGLGASRIKAKYTLGIEEIKGLRLERKALEAERGALEASGASVEKLASVESQIAGIGNLIHEKQMGAVGKLFTKTAAYAIGHAVGGGLTGGLVGVIAGPAALKAFSRALDPLAQKASAAIGVAKDYVSPYLSSAWSKVAEPIEAAWSRVAPYAERVIATPIGKAAVDVGADALRNAAKGTGVAGKIVEGVGDLAAHVPDSVATGAMLYGLPGAAVGYAVHKSAQPIGRAVEMLTNKIAPAGKVAIVSSITPGEWKDIGPELAAVTPAGLDLSIRAVLPESTPTAAKDAVSARIATALEFLSSQQQESANKVINELRAGKQKVSPEGSYERALKAIVDPGTVLESFSNGKLSQEQVKAWEAVYPEALAQLRSVSAAKVARAEAGGGKYTRQQKEQIALLMGDKSLAPRSGQPHMVAAFQGMHQSARNGKSKGGGPGRPRGGPAGFSRNMMTPMQSMKMR